MYKFFNIFFRFTLIFLIYLIWFRYFINNFTHVILYTVLASLITEVGLHFILKRHREKEFMQTKEQTQANKIAISFALNPDHAVEFFYNLSKLKYKATKRKNYIIVNRPDSKEGSHNPESRTVLYPSYSLEIFTPQDVANILNKLKQVKYSKLVICAGNVSKETYAFANQITAVEIILLDKKDAYLKLMKPINYYPEDLVELKTSTKLKIKELVAYSLNRKRSKAYFFASLILLLSSFLFHTNIYYIVMSSLLLLLSLISFILPKYNLIKAEEIL